MTPIDPRFDPRFQRGYTGEGAADAAGADSGERRKPKSAKPARRIDPPDAAPAAFAVDKSWSAQTAMEDEGESDPSWILDELGLGRESDHDRDDGGDDAGIAGIDAETLAADAWEYETRAKPRNPWLIALWVASAALVVLPLLTYWQSVMMQSTAVWTNAGPPIEFIVGQFVMQSAPPLLTLGGLGLLICICMQAVQWNAQDARRPPLAEMASLNDPNVLSQADDFEASSNANESLSR